MDDDRDPTPEELDAAARFMVDRPGHAFVVHSAGVEEVHGIVSNHPGAVHKSVRHPGRNGEHALGKAIVSAAKSLGWTFDPKETKP